MRTSIILRFLFVCMFCPLGGFGDEVDEKIEINLGFKNPESSDERHIILLFVKEEISKVDSDVIFYLDSGILAMHLMIYGIDSREIQENLIKKMEEEQKQRSWRKIYIEFRRQEVWIETGNNSRRRGDEERLLLRVLPAE